jgi:uroporphyrin-III C-methyltransferase/precorrin-2 dehydrogenase/sirohydrochlorin ferrochelatase
MSRLLYPMALDLRGRPVLVVGGGPVAARKMTELLRGQASITVIAPALHASVERLIPAVAWVPRAFQAGDEKGRALVFACTDDPFVNREVADLCAAALIPCNVADQAEAGTFHVPGVIRKGDVTLTVSTGGLVPGLTRYLKRVLSEAVGDEVADLADVVGRFRAGIRKEGASGAGRRDDIRSLLESLPYRRLLDMLRTEGPSRVEAWLEDRAAGIAEPSEAAPAAGPQRGRVTLVGAGPGNPKLLTLAAAEAIRSADVILHDRLIPEETLNLAGRECLLISAGKRGHAGAGESMRQEDINAHLSDHAAQGRHVVRLKGGDPLVFGRGYEEILHLEAAGIPWSLVPGLSSVTAAPAWAGIPLTHRGVARSFAVMSGMAYSATNTVIPKADTLVLLMGLQRLEEIVPAFLAQGWREGTPVAAIQDATLPDQRICRSTLAGIAEATARRGFDSPTLLVIGEVAALGAGVNRGGAPL